MLNTILNSKYSNIIIIICLFLLGLTILYFNNNSLSNLIISSEDKEALTNIDDAIEYLNTPFKGGTENNKQTNKEEKKQESKQENKEQNEIKQLKEKLKKEKELVQIAKDEYDIEKNKSKINKKILKNKKTSKNKKVTNPKNSSIQSWDDMCQKKPDTPKYDDLKLDLNQSIDLEPYNNDDFEDFANFTCK